ncbi:Uncharacterized protein UNQ904/PRO1925-like protein [Camponotus floridanus]|uniref:Uncharacterized protein UNQ904/PRO1925-like protein n=1 Tax=Camponotus floridanus TaxID=104421 RepID=E2AXM3_CAMFO|nr:UPF0764 protein C16orf89 homolog [Camponotus floridanus]EFN61804.1 Uncharacterized protein UNQ904/PRO1925-like protein [Camponotus floridanus]
METKIARFSSVLGIFLLFACFLQTEAAFNPESFEQKLLALDKVLTYINDRTEQMNVDVTYGVTLSEVNLMAALNNDNIQYLENKFFVFLKEMLMLSDFTRRNLMNNVVPTSEIELSLQSGLNNVNLWIKPIWWTRIFPKNKPTPNWGLSYEQVIESIQHGWPNEFNSDQCLFKIMQSGLNKKCKIPQTCTEGLIKHDNVTGYSLTHRLLIIQTAQRFGCQETASLPFSYLIPAFCARIFQDLVNLEAWNFPNVSQDLMIEQIILCGMEGYYEFLDKHYEDLILSWPHWSGCFKLERISEKLKMTPRASSLTDFGCNNHMTSLGAASLALFIRENIENELGP